MNPFPDSPCELKLLHTGATEPLERLTMCVPSPDSNFNFTAWLIFFRSPYLSIFPIDLGPLLRISIVINNYV